jgi:ParB-like chromosome segregation protein Spo0J
MRTAISARWIFRGGKNVGLFPRRGECQATWGRLSLTTVGMSPNAIGGFSNSGGKKMSEIPRKENNASNSRKNALPRPAGVRPTLPPPKRPPENCIKTPERIPARQSENRPVNSLRPFPLQGEMPPTTAEEDAELIADILHQGVLEPIEIVPNGTILSGHRRWAAARQLGWESVRVLVRHDLAAQGEAAIAQRFWAANLVRRQLSLGDMVRMYVRLRRLSPRGSQRRGQGALRDELAKRFQLTGRSLDRWVNIYEGPAEIRQAVESKQLPLVKAGKLLTTLDEQQLAEVVSQLQDDADPRVVADAALGTISRNAKPASITSRALRKWGDEGLNLLASPKKLSRVLDAEGIKQMRGLSVRLQGALATLDGEPQRRKKRRPK